MAAGLRLLYSAAAPLSEMGEFVSWQFSVGVDFRRRYSIAFHQLASEIEELLPRRSWISCDEIGPRLVPLARDSVDASAMPVFSPDGDE